MARLLGRAYAGAVLTRFRLAIFAAAALGAVWVTQALAFWPFHASAPVSIAPAYGGTCEECDLSGRIMVGARMTNSVFHRADFSDAVLTRADASGSQFDAANFTAADLTGVNLVDARCPDAIFERTMLRQADARRASFRGANFVRADVTSVNFDGADIAGADLRRAEGLTQAQLDGACGDDRTRVPRGLRVHRCG